MEKLRCKRCAHTWIRRMETLPVKCPACASPYWNKERKSAKIPQDKTPAE